jgi:hypothetical protein
MTFRWCAERRSGRPRQRGDPRRLRTWCFIAAGLLAEAAEIAAAVPEMVGDALAALMRLWRSHAGLRNSTRAAVEARFDTLLSKVAVA